MEGYQFQTVDKKEEEVLYSQQTVLKSVKLKLMKRENKSNKGNTRHILNINLQKTAIAWLQKKENRNGNRQFSFSLRNIVNIKE